jgi:hypothetical protein
MWRLPFPRVKHPPEPEGSPIVRELIQDVAVDESGQQWGLVIRKTMLSPTMGRLDAVRWVRWEATPFAPDEVVTDTEWSD